jgi:hypothetical protein
MYNKLEGGSTINIQGLECNIPPEGYIFNILNSKLELRGIYSRSDIIEEQYWERFPMPSWYKGVLKSWDNYDKIKKDDDEDFYDERLEDFKQQEWDRRLNGFWFKNNGKSVYLTGFHYYFLQYGTLDIGAPKFRRPDLEKAYFMQYCIEDPLCMGMVEVTKRRFGKSFWAGLFLVEYITRTKMTNGGIQSKTGKDSKKFFSKTVVNPFRRLPKFFRPVYDTSLGANPKSELRFQRPNIRGKNSEQNISEDELGSLIDFESADKVAYDGQKLHRYVADEAGKTVEEDVYERHEVIRFCLLDDEGKIIGKAIYTTTVEKIDSDKDGVQGAFKTLWQESNQNKKGETGMTGTGLYRFFTSAKKTKNIDIYGYPDEEKTLKSILLEREQVKHNPRSLSARIRKEPLTIDEAFMEDGDKCIFNIKNIFEREGQLLVKPVFKRKILFQRDGETQKVKWRDIQKGEEDFCWHLSEDAELSGIEDNKIIKEGHNIKPGRTKFGAIAVDSYSNSQGGRKYGSKASAWIGRKYDITNPDKTNKAVGHLYGRPKEKDELHEQVLLACEWFGYQVWFEHNSDSYDTYFRDRGKRGYLGIYPLSCIEPSKRDKTERHRGVPTTPFSLTTQHDMGVSYFEKHCHLIDFEEILESAKKFDPYNRTEFDAIVSFMILIVVLNEPVIEPAKITTPLIKLYPNNSYVAKTI